MSITTLDGLLKAAGLPVLGVAFEANPAKQPTVPGTYTTHPSSDGVTIGVDWSQVPTAAQDQQAATIIRAFSTAPRKSRLLLDILSDFVGLTANQKSNINTAYFGTRPYPWESDAGINAGAILAVVASAGSVAGLTASQKLGIAALYCQDNPVAFVQPSFDSTINIPGDQLA